jgi:hypothetical protein
MRRDPHQQDRPQDPCLHAGDLGDGAGLECGWQLLAKTGGDVFKKPVVFIVGAGANVDYRMPLGGQLASSIAEAVNFHIEGGALKKGDAALYAHLRDYFAQDRVRKLFLVGRQLAATLSSAASIDDALYQLSDNPEAVLLGKVSIVRAIAKAEANSELKLMRDTGCMEAGAGMNGWIEQVFSMAISECRQADYSKAFENITFVNFNYDRCIEHYLVNALQRVGINENDAENIVGNLHIIRPYGTLGSIKRHAPELLSFGNSIIGAAFNALTRIRTFTESEALHDNEQLQRAMSVAKMFIFLGFGFHRQNLELLSVLKEVPIRSDVQVLATVYGVDPANLDQLRTTLWPMLQVNPRQVFLLDKTAGQMLRDLRLRIMMAVG